MKGHVQRVSHAFFLYLTAESLDPSFPSTGRALAFLTRTSPSGVPARGLPFMQLSSQASRGSRDWSMCVCEGSQRNLLLASAGQSCSHKLLFWFLQLSEASTATYLFQRGTNTLFKSRSSTQTQDQWPGIPASEDRSSCAFPGRPGPPAASTQASTTGVQTPASDGHPPSTESKQ